jgi:hypothetical protein
MPSSVLLTLLATAISLQTVSAVCAGSNYAVAGYGGSYSVFDDSCNNMPLFEIDYDEEGQSSQVMVNGLYYQCGEPQSGLESCDWNGTPAQVVYCVSHSVVVIRLAFQAIFHFPC